MTKIGSSDLALLAADRARESADRSGDPADVGMTTYQVVCALLGTGRASIAGDLAVRVASVLSGSDVGRARGASSGHVRALGRAQRRCAVTGPPLTVVACGAPLAARARDVQAALAAVGWSAALLVSEAATAWAGDGDEARPRPDVVVACPLTFNTADKVVAGVMDTPAAGTLCDALGAGLRIVAVPMVNTRLWATRPGPRRSRR